MFFNSTKFWKTSCIIDLPFKTGFNEHI